MERLTTMHGGMMVPRKACMFDRDGGADDCKECTEICEDEGGVCRTCILQECLTRLGAYEDTGLTPEQIRELKERDTAKTLNDLEENVTKDELRKSFVNRVADILIDLDKEAKTEAEKELVLLMAVTVKDSIEFIPDKEED